MTTSVLLLGHGSVDSVDDVPAFVSAIRRGRPTPPAIVEEVKRRWLAIGGSPLSAITHRQAEALAARLGVRVEPAMRMWRPYVADVVVRLAAEGTTRFVALPVAPHSAHVYGEVAREACAKVSVPCVEAPAWAEEPAMLAGLADKTREAIATLPEDRRAKAHVLYTAHSLPRRVIAAGDPYDRLVAATAAGVAKALATDNPWHVAFQSQGMDGGDWLGPDLPTSFDAIAKAGARDVVVCAVGFLADHTEVLFDLDVEAKALAEARGLSFVRATSLNDGPAMIDALEAVARRLL